MKKWPWFRFILAGLGMMFIWIGWAWAEGPDTKPIAAKDFIMYTKAGILLPVQVKFPKDYDPSRPAILVIALHGKGGSVKDMIPIWDAFANPRFILAVAEAPYPLAGGWSWDFPSRDRRLWEIADPLISDYILNISENLKTQFPIASVYLLGHSQGVAYAYLTGLLHPGKIRGLVLFAGIYPQEFLPTEAVKSAIGEMRFFIAHGRNDQSIGMGESEKAKKALQEMGAEVRFFSFLGGHRMPEPALREVQKWIEADLAKAK